MRTVLLALLTCVVLAGCSRGEPEAEPAGSPTTSEPSRSTSHTPAPTPSPAPSEHGRAFALPDFTAVNLLSARERLAEDGVVVRAVVVRDCRLLAGVVVAQEPAPGTRVRAGATVSLTVGRRPLTQDCARRTATSVGRAFHDWATGGAPQPHFAPHVRLLQGNRQVASLTAVRAADRTAWRLPAGYAELGQLDLLDWMADQVLLQQTRGLSANCLERVSPLPADLVDRLGWSSTWMPASADACLQMAAVQVWVDDHDRISAVGFLSGSP